MNFSRPLQWLAHTWNKYFIWNVLNIGVLLIYQITAAQNFKIYVGCCCLLYLLGSTLWHRAGDSEPFVKGKSWWVTIVLTVVYPLFCSDPLLFKQLVFSNWNIVDTHYIRFRCTDPLLHIYSGTPPPRAQWACFPREIWKWKIRGRNRRYHYSSWRQVCSWAPPFPFLTIHLRFSSPLESTCGGLSSLSHGLAQVLIQCVWFPGCHAFLCPHSFKISQGSPRRHSGGSPEYQASPPCLHCLIAVTLLPDWQGQWILTEWWMLFLSAKLELDSGRN